jgi:hypothetical protein
MKIRTLRDLGKAIEALNTDHQVSVTKSWSSTDRKIPGTRLRHVGKGRHGLRIEVFDQAGKCVLYHDTSETYRTVCEAVLKANKIFGTDFECWRVEEWR